MATAKKRKELTAEWWAADYSWVGLLDPEKNIAGDGGLHGAISLQDYWRIDPATGNLRGDADMRAAGELETDPDGSHWHIVHVPMAWRDGSAAKAGWSDEKRALLATIVAKRIAAAKECIVKIHFFSRETVDGVDGRAQLQGSILRDPPVHPAGVALPIHIAATRCSLPAWDAARHQFGPGAIFDSAIFTGDVSFSNATFTGDASFNSTAFKGSAMFDRATFAEGASFDSATFTEGASFNGANFKIGVGFFAADFTGDAFFLGAIFTGEARFFCVIFTGEADFRSAIFEKPVHFWNAKFEVNEGGNAKSGTMRFNKAIFEGSVDFDGAVFAAKPAHHSAAFEGARFVDLVNFRGCGDHWVAALDEADIKGRILIDERDEADSLRDFDKVVLPRARDARDNPDTKESRLKELEGGCRTIKVAMGAARNEIMEQRYYRFQLRARREQAGVPISERFVSYLFGWAADYGLSLNRPLAGLALVLTIFTVVYALFWGATGNLDSASLIKSIEMAASRIFPFGAFEEISKNWFNELECRGAYPWTVLCARLFASLQSLIALLLIFLFGLAVRRRFKVGE